MGLYGSNPAALIDHCCLWIFISTCYGWLTHGNINLNVSLRLVLEMSLRLVYICLYKFEISLRLVYINMF